MGTPAPPWGTPAPTSSLSLYPGCCWLPCRSPQLPLASCQGTLFSIPPSPFAAAVSKEVTRGLG